MKCLNPNCAANKIEGANYCPNCGHEYCKVVVVKVKDEINEEINQTKKTEVQIDERENVRMLPFQKIEIKQFLCEYNEKIKKSNDWIAPLGIVVTILVAFASSFFVDAGSSFHVWKKVLIFSLLFSFLLSIGFLFYVLCNCKKVKKINEDQLVDVLWERHQKKKLVSEIEN